MSNASTTPPANPYGPEGPTYDQQARDLAYHILREQGQDPLLASQDDWHDACNTARQRIAQMLATLDDPRTWVPAPELPEGAYWVNPDAPEEGYDYPASTMEHDTRPIEPGPGWTTHEVWICEYQRSDPDPEMQTYSLTLWPCRNDAVTVAEQAVASELELWDDAHFEEWHLQEGGRSAWVSTWSYEWSNPEWHTSGAVTVRVAMAHFGYAYSDV